MLHGGVLASLAGTATVCAVLAYLNPRARNGTQADGSDEDSPSAASEEQGHGAQADPTPSGHAEGGEIGDGGGRRSERGNGADGERKSSLLSSWGGTKHWLAKLTPSARNTVRTC